MIPEEEIKILEREIEKTRKENELLKLKLEAIDVEKAIVAKNTEIAGHVTLKRDWLAVAAGLNLLKDAQDLELRDSFCIEFTNELRKDCLKDIENDSDQILVLKATAYESYYKVIVATLEQRNLKIRVAGRERFNEALAEGKAKKLKKEIEKIEHDKAQTPRERSIRDMMILGLTREMAEAQYEIIFAAAKNPEGVKK